MVVQRIISIFNTGGWFIDPSRIIADGYREVPLEIRICQGVGILDRSFNDAKSQFGSFPFELKLATRYEFRVDSGQLVSYS